MKKGILRVIVALMLILVCTTTALCEGDVYRFSDREDQPMTHWFYMNESEIKNWESQGWVRYTGVLWYDANGETAEIQWPEANEVQGLYNQGYTFQIVYHWLLPANLASTNEEVSVYVGRKICSPAEAIKRFTDYKPMAPVAITQNTGIVYYTICYYEGKECEWPTQRPTDEMMERYTVVRYRFNYQDNGYGEVIYFADGYFDEYDYADVMGKTFNNEIPHYNDMK